MCGAGCASSSCSARSWSTPWSTMPPGTKKCKKVGKTCLFSALLEYSMLWSTVNYASRYKKTCKKVGKTCLFSALLVYTLVNFASTKKHAKKEAKHIYFGVILSLILFSTLIQQKQKCGGSYRRNCGSLEEAQDFWERGPGFEYIIFYNDPGGLQDHCVILKSGAIYG